MFGLFANVCRTENLAFVLCKIGRESKFVSSKTKENRLLETERLRPKEPK